MKMKQLVDAAPSMQKIAGQDLHTGTLYRISRLLGKAEPHLKFYDERRAAILEECGVWENGKYANYDKQYYGTGVFTTLETRKWMDELGAERSYHHGMGDTVFL
jgi:hypothetical protein